MNITRPTVTVVASPSGKQFTIEWTADSWSNKYQHLERFDTSKQAANFGVKFSKDFDAEATDIEEGVIPRHHIPTTLCDNGIAKSRRKVTTGRFGK